jgi:phosphoglycolate phosphatase
MSIILFDFDGVLADTLEDMLRFAREACAQLGFPRNPTPVDLNALETMSFAEYGRQLKLPPQHIDRFVSHCLQLFNHRPSSPKIFDGMQRVVSEAAKHNTIAIITGNTTPTVAGFLAEYDLQEHIRLVIGVEQRGTRPEKIRRALKELAQPGDEAYMVGDAVSDIRAARQASIKSIAVGWGHQSPSRLREAKPDYLVKSPQELLELLKEM